MIQARPRASIYHAEGGWFSANWHFSFDRYYDPNNMGWGTLRVFNDDRLVPGAAWPMHPHRDIEGITYVAEGTFEHSDSEGNGGVLLPGSLQRATLGSGMQHSEMNHSKTEPMRFIQMWIMPSRRGLPPSVEQRAFPADERRNHLRPVVVPARGFGPHDPEVDGDAVTVHQNARVYASLIDAGKAVTHGFPDGFGGYLLVVHGTARIAGGKEEQVSIDEGGAAKIGQEAEIRIVAGPEGAEILLVEVELFH